MGTVEMQFAGERFKFCEVGENAEAKKDTKKAETPLNPETIKQKAKEYKLKKDGASNADKDW